MHSRDYQGLAGGLLVAGAGLFALLVSLNTLRLGTLQSMGPGMFPAAVGVLLIVLGLIIAVAAAIRPGDVPRFRLWTPLFIFVAMLAFGATIVPFGLMPAVFLVTLISALAELRVKILPLLGLCVFVCIMAWLVFSVGLRLNAPLFRWPF